MKKVRGPRILHFATHGFFLPASRESAEAGTRGFVLEGSASGGPVDPTEPLNAPLLRSGLAFASANARPAEGDDGLLTALEAAERSFVGSRRGPLGGSRLRRRYGSTPTIVVLRFPYARPC